jgi:hypothetical protein
MRQWHTGLRGMPGRSGYAHPRQAPGAAIGRGTIRFIAEMPPHACINEIVISPTWNRIFLGAPDIGRT